jgi:hypothetical protein
MKSPNVTRTLAFGTSATFCLEYVLWRRLAMYSNRYFRRRLEHKPLPLAVNCSHTLWRSRRPHHGAQKLSSPPAVMDSSANAETRRFLSVRVQSAPRTHHRLLGNGGASRALLRPPWLSPLPACDSHQLALCRHAPPIKILLANSAFAHTARGLQWTQSHFVHCAD